MILNNKHWKTLMFFGLGLALGASFCMKWIEADLWVNGKKFTILGLELFYSKDKLAEVLAGLDPHVRTILRYHLSFDFAFMGGVYPGLAALCMMAREKLRLPGWRTLFMVLAALQSLAWGFDIAENCFLFHWINDPAIGNNFGLYHLVVAAKWLIALIALVFALPVVIRKRNN